MSDHRCYEIGPTLAADERPWPITWESKPYRDALGNECTHDTWELVLLGADGERRVRVEEVVRCRECHAPRCGHSRDEDPVHPGPTSSRRTPDLLSMDSLDAPVGRSRAADDPRTQSRPRHLEMGHSVTASGFSQAPQ